MDLIKMARVVVTLNIMPTGPDVDLDALSEKAAKEVRKFAEIEEEDTGNIKIDHQPVAFGLKAVVIIFAMNESKGGTDELEKKISLLDGVNSVEVTDVRRAVG